MFVHFQSHSHHINHLRLAHCHWLDRSSYFRMLLRSRLDPAVGQSERSRGHICPRRLAWYTSPLGYTALVCLHQRLYKRSASHDRSRRPHRPHPWLLWHPSAADLLAIEPQFGQEDLHDVSQRRKVEHTESGLLCGTTRQCFGIRRNRLSRPCKLNIPNLSFIANELDV